jgi:hypoxanthine phosphoribosyltransferase
MKPQHKRIVYSATDISHQVERLARQISADYQGKDLVLVGVLKGAFIFLADLVRHLTIPAKIDFVRLASYESGTASSGKIKIIADTVMDLCERDLLIVEDIVDSGLTTAFLRQHLLAQEPHSVKICTLVDKKERRRVEVPVDYVGLHLGEGFVIGYGLDCDEEYRCLSDIYELIL